MTKNEKISATLKARYANQPHPSKGKPGRKPTDEQKDLLRKRSIEAADRKGRVSEKHKKARNIANVLAYRARQKNAIPEDANLELIKIIYENCPEGYHVDHIKALASGGPHHQNNLQYLPASENCRKGRRDKYDRSLALRWQDTVLFSE